MRIVLTFLLYIVFSSFAFANAGHFSVSGKVVDDVTQKPLSYATIRIQNMELWAISDDNGKFLIANIPTGQVTVEVKTLGYVTRTFTFALNRDTDLKSIRMKEDNLSVPGVEVTARKKTLTGATTYTMDRTTLDHSQVLSLSDVSALLPGGQTVNSSLMNDSRFALRSGSGERGNAAFGTAVEIDGMRLDNNANMGETSSPSTRSISASNIESVEVIAGIPGVEYGDVSNGVVKVNTRKGRSPWILEASVNPYTRQVSLSKGLLLSHDAGTLNFSVEHANSFSELASPYTAYNRNILSASFGKVFYFAGSSLNLTASLSGNIGGYNSKADPDAFKDTYEKQRDNQLRGNLQLDWLINSLGAGVFNIGLQAAFSTSDRR